MENDILAALANPIRLRLIICLGNGKKNVQELIGNCGLAQSAVSQHLTKLKDARLIKDEKEGRFVYYSVTRPGVLKIAHEMELFLKEVEK